MCERIVQFRSKQAYAQALGWYMDGLTSCPDDRIAHWNVPPGSQPWLLHRIGSPQGQIDMINWGFRPPLINERSTPLAARVRIDEAKNGPYFKTMFRTGRAIVPVDGWYEWVGNTPNRQPWHIRHISREPFFLAAICSYRPHNTVGDGTGFVIICVSTGGGLIDPLEQRPVALNRRDALSWMDHNLSVNDAADIASNRGIGIESFECFPVGQAVNRLGTNGSQLIVPMSACLDA